MTEQRPAAASSDPAPVEGPPPRQPPWEIDAGPPIERYRCRVLVFFFSLALQLFVVGNHFGTAEERAHVEAADNLIHHGKPLGPGGVWPDDPLLAVWLAPGALARRLIPGNDDVWLALPSSVAAAAVVVPFQRALWAIGVSPGASAIAGALFAASSLTWPYGKRPTPEPFAALLVMAAFSAALAWRSLRRRRSLLLAWLTAAGAVWTWSPAIALLPVLVVMVGFLPTRDGRVTMHRAALTLSSSSSALLFAGWGAYRLFRPVPPPTQPSVVTQLPELLAGFQHGVLVYAPLAFAGAWALWRLRHRWDRAAPWLLVAPLLVLGVVLLLGGPPLERAFGPRPFVPVLALWLLGLGPLLVELRVGALRSWSLRGAVAAVASFTCVIMGIGTLLGTSEGRGPALLGHSEGAPPWRTSVVGHLVHVSRFPDDIDWIWLHSAPREPLEVALPAPGGVVEVQIAEPAARHAWEIAEVFVTTGDEAKERPLRAWAREGRTPEAMTDGVLTTSWVGGPQVAGQWVRVAVGPGGASRRLVFVHGRDGNAWPRHPVVRIGDDERSLGEPAVVRARLGDVELRWPGWLLLIALLLGLRGVQRWSGWFNWKWGR